MTCENCAVHLAELQQARAVVLAAREDAADIGRYHHLYVIPALAALDHSPAGQETQERL